MSRLVLAVAVVLAASVPVARQPAATWTVAGCLGGVGTGCVEIRVTPTGGRPVVASNVRELQMNLCHSGEAHCYRGARTTAEAAGVIGDYAPTVVTLNEVCSADVVDADAPVPAAMTMIARQHGDASEFALFAPAVHRGTGVPFRCTDGDLYGIGLVGRGTFLGTARHYLYTHQLTRSPEERVAVCAEVAGYDACTTHLESDDGDVAAAQCRELMGARVEDFRAATGRPPTLVAGDLNETGIGFCVPSGWTAAGDGALQHVMADGLAVRSVRTVHLRFTDHPALIVDLAG